MNPTNEKFWLAIDYLTAGSISRQEILPLH